jgi:hypothetical protein
MSLGCSRSRRRRPPFTRTLPRHCRATAGALSSVSRYSSGSYSILFVTIDPSHSLFVQVNSRCLPAITVDEPRRTCYECQ